jgi:hypothetical protein
MKNPTAQTQATRRPTRRAMPEQPKLLYQLLHPTAHRQAMRRPTRRALPELLYQLLPPALQPQPPQLPTLLYQLLPPAPALQPQPPQLPELLYPDSVRVGRRKAGVRRSQEFFRYICRIDPLSTQAASVGKIGRVVGLLAKVSG